MACSFISICIFLIFIACVTCQQENAASFTNQTNLTADCSPTNCTNPSALSESPPFWCPVGFKLLKTLETWTHVCRPRSCFQTGKNLTVTCKKFTKTLRSCPKIYLEKSEYQVDDEGVLVAPQHNVSANLGSYVLQSTRAIICDPKGNDTSAEPSERAELPKWCMTMEVPKGSYRKSGQQLFVPNINLHVDLFSVEQDESARVCPEMDAAFTDHCSDNLAILPGHEFEVLSDWSLSHHKNVLAITGYHHSQYILAADKSFALICIVPEEPESKTVFYLFGAASILSVVCLILSIAAHLFYPTLNYHTKALLCLAISYLVMYLALAVRFFNDPFETEEANIALFSVQYISCLGAFFWLSILSFELWRVFTNLRGTITPGDAALNKRIFLAKCVYAWGIPTILCIVIIALTYSPDVQHRLGLDLQLHSTSWLHDTNTMLIVFYTPIIIVLIENVLFFILTIYNLRKASKSSQGLKSKVNKKLFQVYLKLFLVMGLCWFFEVISGFSKYRTGPKVWYFTDIINCLQGVLIFVIYVFKKKTLLIFKHKLGYINSSQMDTTTSTKDGEVNMDTIAVQRSQRNAPVKPCSSTPEVGKLLP